MRTNFKNIPLGADQEQRGKTKPGRKETFLRFPSSFFLRAILIEFNCGEVIVYVKHVLESATSENWVSIYVYLFTKMVSLKFHRNGK